MKRFCIITLIVLFNTTLMGIIPVNADYQPAIKNPVTLSAAGWTITANPDMGFSQPVT